MNATAERLDNFLRETDPETARTIEQIVRSLLALQAGSEAGKTSVRATVGCATLPVYAMGGFRPGVDPHKLGQISDDF